MTSTGMVYYAFFYYIGFVSLICIHFITSVLRFATRSSNSLLQADLQTYFIPESSPDGRFGFIDIINDMMWNDYGTITADLDNHKLPSREARKLGDIPFPKP